jgi:hypothetical protein
MNLTYYALFSDSQNTFLPDVIGKTTINLRNMKSERYQNAMRSFFFMTEEEVDRETICRVL